jgi:hypothetical protein
MNLLTDNESSRASFDLEIDINSILEWSEVDQIDVLAEQYRMKRRK